MFGLSSAAHTKRLQDIKPFAIILKWASSKHNYAHLELELVSRNSSRCAHWGETDAEHSWPSFNSRRDSRRPRLMLGKQFALLSALNLCVEHKLQAENLHREVRNVELFRMKPSHDPRRGDLALSPSGR
ncbi:hypothetical protein RRG08_016188 [Elysia crispata]|uniref:Uncharacterized protein n=1 Tax=Elysia crispata TaxID=231223 RepID=A0AAE1DJJ8_9GAST|nr:hypothetical protein RRG08_016188 [Elysia crispata]